MAFPASEDNTIAVASVNEDWESGGSYRGEAGYGNDLDVLAPVRMYTTDLSGSAGTQPGDYTPGTEWGATSHAAPVVTGLVSMLKAIDDDLTFVQIRDILRHSATKIESMEEQYFTQKEGYGVVNALGAVVGAKYNAQLVEGVIDTNVTLPDAENGKPFNNLYLPADLKIAAGCTVTVSAGTKVYMAASVSGATADSSNLGSDSNKVEILVEGTLKVEGTEASKVEFVSVRDFPATPAPPGPPVPTGPAEEGDWYGISSTTGDGNLVFTHAVIKHAVYGIISSSYGTVQVDTCSFALNENMDLKLGGDPGICVIKGCTLTVGGGTGIDVQDGADNVVLESNLILCDSNTTNGILLEGPAVTVKGNTVKDCTAGNAVYIDSGDPVLTENQLKDSKYAILIEGGSAQIGTSSSSSDNTITGNTRGIYSNCTGPGSCPTCSSFAPKIRNNNVSSNATGIYVDKQGRNVDCGTDTTGNGNNTFTSNTAYCIRNASNCDTIQAVGNWFGAHPPTPCWYGDVNASSPLTSAPAGVELEIVRVQPLRIVGVVPNPVRGGARIHFDVGRPGTELDVRLFDVSGRLVREFPETRYEVGHHRLYWDGQDRRGSRVASGIYFVRAVSDDGLTATHRFIVVR